MKAHLVGGGLASLAAATYLIRDAKVNGPDITIYEASRAVGGALGLAGSVEEGVVYPGGRVFERHYRCTLDFFDLIPSRDDPGKSIKDDIVFFNEHYGWENKCRLIDAAGHPVDASRLGLSLGHRLQLLRILLTRERRLDGRQIRDVVASSFFETNFWYIWSSIMAFKPGHSAVAMRRYLLRFFHLLPQLGSMEFILRTRYHQQQSIVEPVAAWLAGQGVGIETGALVGDLDLDAAPGPLTVRGLHYTQGGDRHRVPVAEDDIVLVTNGAQLSDMTVGTMDRAAPAEAKQPGRGWALWRTLAAKRPELGRPAELSSHVDRSTWLSFTATTRCAPFMERLRELTRREAGRGGLVTFTGSSWLLTFTRFHDPNLIGQQPGTHMLWGYGIYPHRPGDFVDKPMVDCSGREILTELLSHLRMTDLQDAVLATTLCRPCRMPYPSSVFEGRRSDRPQVVPETSTNLGFIGQFCDQPEDVEFTMEYSVRSARTAVATLMQTGNPPPPVFRGIRHPAILARVVRATLR